MKVILEAQHAVGHPQLRGVGYYSLQLIQTLLMRRKNEYELTYFDFNKEIGNDTRVKEYFGKYNVLAHECSCLDYRIASRNDGVFLEKSYNEYTETNGDIYHFMCPVSVPLSLKGKMVVTVHDVIWEAHPGMIPNHTEQLHKIALDRLNKLKPFVIADSESTRQDILKYTSIPEENIKTVYLSYDEDNMYPDKIKVLDIIDGRYFLFVGAFERRKNIAAIVRAFNLIAHKHSDIKLVIAGKKIWDDTSDLEKALEESKFKDRIIFPGYIDVSAKRRLYSNAVAFIFPSLYEGFGIPVLEAMACGCPVITAYNSSLSEVGGDAAIYVDTYNTEQLAIEMNRLLENSSLRNELIIKGFSNKDNFSWNKTAENVEQLYKTLL